MVNPPVYRGSTVLFESYSDLKDAVSGRYKGITYGTDRLPNQRAFEQELQKLEGGDITRTFQSGISAIMHVLMAFTSSGDNILLVENAYGPTTRYCHKVLTRFGVSITMIPGDVAENVSNYIKENTRLIFLESPGSNTFEIQDLRAVAKIARDRGIVTVLDNTWATPLYLDAFDLGIDVSISSVTKYITGHSDVLLGTASAVGEAAKALDNYYEVTELFAASDDCQLAFRGLQTLKLRLDEHGRSALAIATELQNHELVDQLLHPAFASHPQHDLFKRDFKGSSGLFGFTFKREYSDEQIGSFVDSLNHFGLGFSWGGYKSLITVNSYNRPSNESLHQKLVVRVNVGLEDTEVLLADLKQGLSRLIEV